MIRALPRIVPEFFACFVRQNPLTFPSVAHFGLLLPLPKPPQGMPATHALPRSYTKDLARRVTLRLDDSLAEFVTRQSEVIGRTPSEFVRTVLHSYMHAVAGAVGLASLCIPETPSEARTGKAASNENKAHD